ncbi:serine hydrolase [Kibdelosporangium aridum]|uniref:Beta-lactamase enzyme family protein n=1 Tax=Kibdelosporangium aridum TaxID=2030 RepID=A0A1Y5X2Q0_KIBAR|nr:serine hydrolase [Kibdelosporangium aridum]SMC66755.1 Beta-lactamase enzyme family protein [Kibdelosporangium aridum]
MGTTKVLRDARQALDDAGLRGSFLVRDLDTGDELGIDDDAEYPVASLVKVPLAVATLERVARGELDPATPIPVPPGRSTIPGPIGLSKFRHPAVIALEDLLYLSTSMSDSVAADTLFALTPPATVTAELRRLGHDGIAVRHLMADLVDTPAERFPAPRPTSLTPWLSMPGRQATDTPCRNSTSAARTLDPPARSPTCCRACGGRRASSRRSPPKYAS